MCLKYIAYFSIGHFRGPILKILNSEFPLTQQSIVVAVQEKCMKDDEYIDHDD